MAIAPSVPRIRVQIGGAIGASRWSIGLWFQVNPLVIGTVNLATFNTAAGVDFANDVWGSLKAQNVSLTTYDQVRTDVYAAGSLASSANAILNRTAVAGTNSGVSAASQCVVHSLYTATASRRSRGRVYLPATGSIGGGTQPFGFDSSVISTLAGDLATFLNDTEDNADTNFGTGSAAVVQSLTAGQVFPITTVLVDQRPDRQEHREKALSFSRVSAAV